MLSAPLISVLSAAVAPARHLEFAVPDSVPTVRLCPAAGCTYGCGESVLDVKIPSGYCAACYDDGKPECAIHGPDTSTGLFIDVPDFFTTDSRCCNVQRCRRSVQPCAGSEPSPPPVKPVIPFMEARATASQGKRPPLAFAASGGGDRAFTQAMALARAGGVIGMWPLVTHIISNSGGSWFSSSFLNSKGFYEALLDPSLPMDDVVRIYKNLSNAVVGNATAQGKLISLADVTLAPQPGSTVITKAKCAAYASVYSRVMNKLTENGPSLPYVDWEAFTTAAYLVGAGQSPQPSADPNLDATQIVQATIPPNTYVSRTQLSTLVVETEDATTAGWLAKDGTTIRSIQWPISHVLGGAYTPPSLPSSEWNYGSAVTSFKVRDETSGDMQLLPDEAATQTTLSGISSADVGLMSSPRMMTEYLPLALGENSSVAATFPLCLPGEGGTEKLAVSTPSYKIPTYRLLDGGATDNSGIALALHRLGRECEAVDSTLDCSNGVYLAFLDANGPRKNFSSTEERTLRYLFSIPRTGLTPAPPGGLNDVANQGTVSPSTRVFAQPFPPENEWKPWLDSSLPESPYPIYQHGQYWQGVVDTIDNPWVGVKAGLRVNLLIMRAVLDRRTFFNPTVYFNNFFAKDAVDIARDAQPLLEAFLYGA